MARHSSWEKVALTASPRRFPLGSNEAEENRIVPRLNPARASDTSGRSAATPGLSHARIAAARGGNEASPHGISPN